MRRFNLTLLSAAFLLATIFLMKPQSASAQFGIKIGALAGEDFAGSQTLPSPFPAGSAQGASGYTLGLVIDKNLVGPFSIMTEFLLTQRTFKEDMTIPSEGSSPVTWTEKLQYLQIPILFKVSPLDGAFQPYGFIGPNIGFKLSASAITDSTGSSQTNDQSALFNSVDLGLDLGLGLGVEIIPLTTVFADARYTYGLVDVYNHYNASGAGDLRARDVKWTAGVMIGF